MYLQFDYRFAMVRSMIRAAFLFLLFSGTAFTQTAPAVPPSSNASLIENYERGVIEAERQHDWEAIARHLAPDFLEIAGDGNTYTKSQVATYFSDVKLNGYTISEVQENTLAADVTLITYRIAVDASFKGQPVPHSARVSSVWTRQSGTWLMKFHQSTPIPQ